MMKAKFLYNTLLTVGIVLMIMSSVAAYNSGQQTILVVSVLLVILLVWLKIRLLKDVRQTINKK